VILRLCCILPAMSEQEVARLTRLLQDAVKLSRQSNRAVERKMGLSGGYLSRLFSGIMELRVSHVIDICNAIDFPPAEFFRAAYPMGDGEDPEGSNLQRALAKLHPAPLPEGATPAPKPPPQPVSPPPAASANTEEMEKLLMGALRRLLAEQFGKS
jgi:hypothetical protein